jgi:hypothetical protein
MCFVSQLAYRLRPSIFSTSPASLPVDRPVVSDLTACSPADTSNGRTGLLQLATTWPSPQTLQLLRRTADGSTFISNQSARPLSDHRVRIYVVVDLDDGGGGVVRPATTGSGRVDDRTDDDDDRQISTQLLGAASVRDIGEPY